jgi:hypothetical protein
VEITRKAWISVNGGYPPYYVIDVFNQEKQSNTRPMLDYERMAIKDWIDNYYIPSIVVESPIGKVSVYLTYENPEDHSDPKWEWYEVEIICSIDINVTHHATITTAKSKIEV